MVANAQQFIFLLRGPEVDHIGPESLCYKLQTLPPNDDFPVIVDLQGKPVCRYRDHKWLIGAAPLNFGTDLSDLGPKGRYLTDANGELLKRCVAWFMFGERRGISVLTLTSYHTNLKRIFAFCSSCARPIVASDLSRYFDSMDVALAQAIPSGSSRSTIYLLHELWQARDHLGFTLLNPEQIARLMELIPAHVTEQTEFIPPRIWAYQAGRMQACLRDFLEHKAQFESALYELIDAYRSNFGSLITARDTPYANRNPCRSAQAGRIRGCTYIGSFVDVAERHGIRGVIGRWLFRPGTTWDDLDSSQASPQMLTQYFNALGLVGTAYLQCFSGMRFGEAMSLRCNCLSVEHDSLLGDIHILSGETTKTTQDDDARWLAAPTVEFAVESLSIIARWRTAIAVEYGDVPLTLEDKTNPYLVCRPYENWANGNGYAKKLVPSALRPSSYEISRWRNRVPGLFEDHSLCITADDEAYVRRFNTNANLEHYGEGQLWHLTSHQYRRTSAVMMGASQVSLEAQQYQFKQLTLNQSGYYRNGFQSLRLNRAFTQELVSTKYELVSLELGLLNGPEYVSPLGPSRKNEILRFFEISSGDEIQKAAKKGQLAVKQTLFGICTRLDSCPYGGHDNIAYCPDCKDALLSKRKRGSVEQLGKTIAVRLVDVPLETPLRAQLERSAKAVERFMNVTA
ncbi:hypothetical protein [Solilutibacter silvestris]|uniref:Integrase n=1 Tax=Solilutibacter silvestris TaxID=1645665 RepID=A0A2K1Q425_9GAMM|nr:hypothetical protein [Lysobacter silvestris]PNS09763.1 hypothetical protein Lysil_1392 [Lysobacter silvestris]